MCLDYKARISLDKGNIEESLDYLQEEEVIFRKLGNLNNLIKCLSNQGIDFYIQGLYEKALNKFQEAKKICKENGIKEELASVYENISLAYRKLNEKEKFLKYHNKVKEFLQYDKDPKNIGIILNNSLLTLKGSNVPEENYNFLTDALQYCEKNNLIGTKVIILANLADILIQRGDFDKGEQLLSEAIALSEKYNLNIEKADVLETLGRLLSKKGETEKSITVINNSIKIAKSLNYVSLLIENYVLLGDIQRNRNRLDESFRNYSLALIKFKDITDNITSIELKEQFQKSYENLPKLMEEINNLIESGMLEPNLGELVDLQTISTKACEKVKTKFGLNNESCKEQNLRLKENIMKEFGNKIDTILDEFNKLNYSEILRDFKEALEVYDNKRRSPISMIRNVLEGLVKTIIQSLNEIPQSMNTNLHILEKKGILKATPENAPDRHLEITRLLNLYGLLSTHGSHPNPLDSEMVSSLFIQTIDAISLLLKRIKIK